MVEYQDDLAPGWVWDQAVNGALSLVTAVVVLFQLLSERYSPRPVVAVKKLYHRITLAACLVNALRTVDPQGMRGVWSSETASILSGNVTLLLYLCVSAATYYSFNAVYGLSQMAQSKPVWFRNLMYTLSTFAVVTVNSLYVFMMVDKREFVRGIIYIILAVSFFTLAVIAFLAVQKLRTSIQDILTSPLSGRRDFEPSEIGMHRSMKKLLMFQIVGGAIVTATLFFLVVRGSKKLRDTSEPVVTPDPHSYSPMTDMFNWLQWIGIFFFVWWAWIPVYYCYSPEDFEESKRSLYASSVRRSYRRGSGRLPPSTSANSLLDKNRRASSGTLHASSSRQFADSAAYGTFDRGNARVTQQQQQQQQQQVQPSRPPVYQHHGRQLSYGGGAGGKAQYRSVPQSENDGYSRRNQHQSPMLHMASPGLQDEHYVPPAVITSPPRAQLYDYQQQSNAIPEERMSYHDHQQHMMTSSAGSTHRPIQSHSYRSSGVGTGVASAGTAAVSMGTSQGASLGTSLGASLGTSLRAPTIADMTPQQQQQQQGQLHEQQQQPQQQQQQQQQRQQQQQQGQEQEPHMVHGNID